MWSVSVAAALFLIARGASAVTCTSVPASAQYLPVRAAASAAARGWELWCHSRRMRGRFCGGGMDLCGARYWNFPRRLLGRAADGARRPLPPSCFLLQQEQGIWVTDASMAGTAIGGEVVAVSPNTLTSNLNPPPPYPFSTEVDCSSARVNYATHSMITYNMDYNGAGYVAGSCEWIVPSTDVRDCTSAVCRARQS